MNYAINDCYGGCCLHEVVKLLCVSHTGRIILWSLVLHVSYFMTTLCFAGAMSHDLTGNVPKKRLEFILNWHKSLFFYFICSFFDIFPVCFNFHLVVTFSPIICKNRFMWFLNQILRIDMTWLRTIATNSYIFISMFCSVSCGQHWDLAIALWP